MMGCVKFVMSLILLSASLVLLPDIENKEESLSFEEALNVAENSGFEGDILFSNFSEECTLPCWNDIIVGNSAAISFLESLDGFQFSWGPTDQPNSTDFDQVWRAGNNLSIQAGEDTFRLTNSVTGVFDDNTLQSLEFVWQDYGLLEMLPQVVLSKLGVPSEIYVAYDVHWGKVLWLEYQELQTDIFYLSFETNMSPPFELCTDASAWTEGSILAIFVTNINNPAVRSSRIETIVPLDRYSIFDITDVSSYTAERFMRDVIDNSNVCLSLDEEFVIESDEEP